jgi:Mrp family chromosome partitioning ATPase
VTLGDLADALRRFQLLTIGLFVAIFGAGILAAVLPAERYRTSAVVSVEPISQSVGFETQQAIQLTIPPTIARLVSATFEQGVRSQIEPRFRDAPITIKGVQDPGTAIIDVTVDSSSPAAAENAAAIALQRLVGDPRSDRFRVNIVSPPDAASSVKAQRTPPILLGSLVLGLIVALLTAAALHRLLPPVPRADLFRKRYGHDLLGEIPRARRRDRGAGQAMMNGNASDELNEAFRSLEARFSRRAAERSGADKSMSIVVTSWGKVEGKSTVVANLACALAAHDHDVTVVDFDMRRPRIHKLLGSSIEPGVSDVAAGRAVASVLQHTTLASLDVVAAGPGRLSRHPAEIAQDAMPLLLSVLTDRIVLIDAPPLFTAETTTIIGEADFVLLVADYRKRRPDDIDAALADLEQIGTPLLGVVLNRVDVTDTRGRESYLYRPAAPAPAPAEAPAPARARARRAKRGA